MLAEDETELLLFPPLRAAWAKRGLPVRVGLSGRNDRRVLFGAVNLRNGDLVLLCRRRQRAPDFCAFLRHLRRRYPKRPLALLLDENPCHTAKESLEAARELRIRLLWLPKRCPELNPMEHLWRALKQQVCANRQDETIERTVARSLLYLRRLEPRDVLRKAGVLSPNFWLRWALSKKFP